jgi:hypothetical protein
LGSLAAPAPNNNSGSGLVIRAAILYIEPMDKICSVPDCGKKIYRRTYCNAHYMRWKRYGDPLVQKRRSPGSVTDEDRKRWAREEYQRNKDKYIARAKRWAEENPERSKEIRAKEDNQKKARQRTKEWSAKNKDRKRASDKAWTEANRGLSNSYKAHRRAKERKATPSWLTAEHRDTIAQIYAEALDLTQRLGIRHEVDHIVPLSGKTVSGLHVPWNLRAIPAQENNTRPRVWITQYDPPHPG